MHAALNQAMILAAGRGARMRPITDTCPKPLLRVHGKPLMQWPLEALARAGIERVVVNTDWLAHQICDHFGDNFVPAAPLQQDRPCRTKPVRIRYSHEGLDFGHALETAGGIVRVLPDLSDVFWVLAGDVFAPDFVFSNAAMQRFAASGRLAHVWLVPNPEHHPHGDFGLEAAPADACGPVYRALASDTQQLTFSTIALYRKALFRPPYCDIPPGNPEGRAARLAPILRAAMEDTQVTAEIYTGEWADVGTPERLVRLNQTPDPRDQ
ncbi:MAG: nucleotidyltransferase family protein [Rhodoferax sp.]|nr:nucleotidyltransferase family protein [Rhodoferax sp.]